MATTHLTTPREELLALAARHADDFATRAAQHDAESSYPHENLAALQADNMLSVPLPVEYGGRGAGLHDYALVARRLAHGCESTALSFTMHNWFVGMVASLWQGSEAGPLRDRLEEALEVLAAGAIVSGVYSEPGTFGFTASDVKAEKVDGGYIFNGRKLFWSNQPATTFLTTSAQLDRDTLLFYMGPLADTTGIRAVEDWDVMGMRATGSNSALFENAFMSEKWIWELPAGRYGDAVGAVGGIWFGTGVAAVYSGIAEAARNIAVDWVKGGREKYPFPPGLDKKPLMHFPHIQFLATEMDVLLQAMDHALRCTAFDREANLAWDCDAMVEVWRTKHFVTTSAVQVVEKAMTVIGGGGYFRKSPLERLYRSVRAGEFHPLSWPDLAAYAGKLAFDIDPHVEPRYW